MRSYNGRVVTRDDVCSFWEQPNICPFTLCHGVVTPEEDEMDGLVTSKAICGNGRLVSDKDGTERTFSHYTLSDKD